MRPIRFRLLAGSLVAVALCGAVLWQLGRKEPIRSGAGKSGEFSGIEGGRAVTPEQQTDAFQQLRQVLAGKVEMESGPGQELRRFKERDESVPAFAEEEFVIRTDDYGNVVGHNPAHGFEADFSGASDGGVSVRSTKSGGSVNLRTVGIGSMRMDPEAGSNKPVASGSRVEISRGPGITEWYVNRESGLEQGWTFSDPPGEAADSGELRIDLELKAGRLEAMPRPGRSNDSADDGIGFRDREGREVFRYGKLVVKDSRGVELPSRMKVATGDGGETVNVTLIALAGGADYPVIVDPLVSSHLGAFSPKPLGTNILWATEVGGFLYFVADDGTTGEELWKSDGTTAGTVLVKDIYPGSTDSFLGGLTMMGGELFFRATDGICGQELWKSDGTTAGTVLVKDIYDGSDSSSPLDMTELEGFLFFAAYAASRGSELWKSDGTSGGTVLVREIQPGSLGAYPSSLTVVDGTLFFAANQTGLGNELWKSDGTGPGTEVVTDIAIGIGGSRPNNLTNVGGTLFFSADDEVHGIELWKSDGTGIGTVMVKDVVPGEAHSSPGDVTVVGGLLYFSVPKGFDGEVLWKSDGTEAGTVLVKDIKPGSRSYTSSILLSGVEKVDGTLFFRSDGGTGGEELWASDGTPDGTMMPRDIYPGPESSDPILLTEANGMLFFRAEDGVNGVELWKSDGTTAGTIMVKDIKPGSDDSFPSSLIEFNGILYFQANDGATGGELWKSDGTTAGTVLVKEIRSGSGGGFPTEFVEFDGNLYFRASDSANGIELWKSDGTTAGTVLVKDIYPGPENSRPESLTVAGGALFFTADDGTHGIELWKTDGTAAGTMLVEDIFPDPADSGPLYLTESAGFLYFIANDGTSGYELWRSDGSAANTALVKDIVAGPAGSRPSFLASYDGNLYFRAYTGASGEEFWTSDGTAAGTVMVKDIFPGASSSRPLHFMEAEGSLYFAADDGSNGMELWKSDGTMAGTALVEDLYPGPVGAFPEDLYLLGRRLIYSGEDGSGDRSLRSLPFYSEVIINEVDALTLNGDGMEFIELFDGGVGNLPLDDLVLVLFEGSTDTSYAAFDLDGKTTNGAGYFVIGNVATPNVDWVIADGALKDGTDAVAIFLGNGSDFPVGSAIPTSASQLIDALVYDTGQPNDVGLNLALLRSGQLQKDEGENGFASGQSLQRLPNGAGQKRETAAFSALSPTPGMENALPGSPADLSFSAGGTPSVSGTARAGSVVTLMSDVAGVLGEGQADLAGNWSVPLAAPLTEGPHRFTTTADGSAASSGLDVTIDNHGDTPGTATSIAVGGGGGVEMGWVENGDADVFSFTMAEVRHVRIEATGNVDTLGVLRDSSANLRNDPAADDNQGTNENFQIEGYLFAGDYTLEVTGKGANPSGAYQLQITLGALAIYQPDTRVGNSETGAIGGGVYETAIGQTVSLVSKRARIVRAVAIFENASEVPDSFAVRGTGGNGLFAVTYTNGASGNVTAGIVSGTYSIGTLAPGDPGHVVNVTVRPNKRRIVKKVKRAGRRKVITKKKRLTLTLRCVSDADVTAFDFGIITVRTK